MRSALHPDIASHRDSIIELARGHGIKRLCLMGSMARGDDGPESDADFLFKLPDDVPSLGLKQLNLEGQLARIIGRPVEMLGEHMLQPWWREVISPDLVVLYDDAA